MSSTTNIVKHIVNGGKYLLYFSLYLNFLFSTEYLILTNNNLLEAASKISNIYSNSSTEYYLETEIIIVDTLNVEISDFINSKIENNENLKYLLIIGDENNFPILTKSVNCNEISDEFPTDDLYSSLGENHPPRLSTGRIPASNLNEALNFIEKLENYITNPTSGYWKNRVLLVSDDEIKNNSSIQNEIQHTVYSDSIFQKLSSNTFIETLYGPMYDTEYFGSERRLPALTEDIIENLNKGASLINYIGHGDVEKWSAEHLIEKNRDIDLIDIPNNKLPIWIAGTCYFGRYDNVDSMSEALLFDTNGAISIVGATRAISTIVNKKFLDSFYNNLENHIQGNSNDEILRLGDLFLSAKNDLYNEHPTHYHYTSSCDGGYLYDILGDPALPLPFGIKNPNIINTPQEFNVLETYIFESSLSSQNYSYVQLSDQDKTIDYSFEENDSTYLYTFNYTPSLFYESQFAQESCYTFPLDLITNDYVNLKYYSENYNDNYILSLDSIPINHNEGSIYDQTGPKISFQINDIELTDNLIIDYNQNINVVITDSSGINTTNNIGHATRYWFKNLEYSNTLLASDYSIIESCDGISIPINLPSELDNNNKLYVESWDNLNNRSIDSLHINLVSSNNGQIIFNVLNFPNPFKEKTFFTYQIKNIPSNYVKTTINIYTQAGELITSLYDERVDNFIAIEWDGKDSNSNNLPNGTYLYTLNSKLNNKIYTKNGVLSIIR